MILPHIVIFCIIAVLISLFVGGAWRARALMAVSVLSVYWLQPATPLRHFDFWLPTISLVITILVWVVVHPHERRMDRGDIAAVLVLSGLILIVALTRFLPTGWQLTTTRPPEIGYVILVITAFVLCAFLLYLLRHGTRWWMWLFSLLIVAIFVTLKFEPLTFWASRIARSYTGQKMVLASHLDLRWLGYSYIAFRLLHRLRDRSTNRLSALSLQEHVSYVLFFPALIAGPIDRGERFVSDLRAAPRLDRATAFKAGARIIIGIFKKFVVADGLSLLAFNGVVATQVDSPLGLWCLLYAFAWRIYLDFSGYTDVAIGIGLLTGVFLPENFDRPYLQSNIAAFWNRWHITLAQWFRFYFFNPITRILRGKQRRVPAVGVIFLGQVSTMALIGLWHGVTWNFLYWGLWHGLGLFIHNRWQAFLRVRPPIATSSLLQNRAMKFISSVLTFHFVTLGWVWFALPDVELSLTVFRRLLGV